MKPRTRSLAAAAMSAGLLLSATHPVVAADLSIPPQVLLDVKGLVGDLQGIAAHSEIDPSDLAALAADLQLALSGAVKPSLDSVRKLATDAQTALADGKFTTQEEITLIGDLNDVLTSAGFSSDDIQKIQSQIYSIVTSSGVTQADFKLVVGDLTGLLADLQGTFIVTTSTIQLGAPAEGSRATGVVAKESGGDSATIVSALRAAIGAQASVAVNTQSLETGTYSVNVTSATDGAKKTLGALVVSGNPGESGVGAATFGAGGQALPEGFDASDIASVNITEGDDDTPVLTGDTAEAKTVRSGSFALTAGAAGPTTKGSITFQTKVKPSGASKSTFLLFAKKLPASTKLSLRLNGEQALNVKTDAKGKLLVIAGNVAYPTKGDGVTPLSQVYVLPSSVDVSAVQSVELETADGATVATGGLTN